MVELGDLQRDDFKPLYVQLAERVAEYISEAGLKPGERVPSQNELIERYGISQITVRLAFQRLISEGLINTIQGSGTFVAEPKIKERIQNVQSMEERLLSEGLIVENRCLEIAPAFPSTRVRNDLRLPPNAQTIKIRRLKYIGGNLIGIETRHFPQHLAEKFHSTELGSEPFVKLLNRLEDNRVARISYHTRAGIILELEANLMNVSADSPVLIQYSVMFDANNQPLVAGRITYLADKIELNYEVIENAGSSIKFNLK
jgi:GntR family transcriptional regulator